MALADQIILRGTRAAQPVATALTPGAIYCVTDEGRILERTTGAAWESYSSAAGAGDVTASGTLTSGAVLVGGGTTVAAATTTGTGVVTAIGVNVGSAGAVVVNGGALGTPSSGTLTSCTGLPIAGGGTGQTTATAAFDALAPTTTAGDLIYSNGTDNVRLAIGTAAQVLTVNGGATAPSWAAASGGAVVQVKNTQTGAVATGTTVIPLDDTIPQNTEGDEYMTLAITPTSATNKLKIDVVFNGAHSVSAWMIVALFQDATAGALATGANYQQTAGGADTVLFSHYMTSGTTSATTFKVRAGGNTAGTVTFNGTGGARSFGGVFASSITISELVP